MGDCANEYSLGEYRRAYVEVLQVLDTLDKKSYNRIPCSRLRHLQEEQDENYHFVLNRCIPFKHQISKLAQEILAYMFVYYIATDEEKAEVRRRKREKGLPVDF